MSRDRKTINEKVAAIKQGDFKSRDWIEGCFEKIKTENASINAVVETFDQAIDKAKKIDQNPKGDGRLLGVPVLVKDNFCVKGQKATAASKILQNFTSPYSAFCLEQLEKEGAILIGRTNMDEFGMGSSNENSFYGPCKNPWNRTRVPGGSSGGSAAAIASDWAPLATGSDTGGSIRQPASFCGVVGIKPTYGSISRYGLIAFASSLDQPGLFARTVQDAALGLEVMFGKDSKDSTNVTVPKSLIDGATPSLKGKTVGVISDFFDENLGEETRVKINNVLEIIKDQGGKIKQISLPHCQYAIPTYYLIGASEASSNLSRYDGVRFGLRAVKEKSASLEELYINTRTEGFGAEVKRRILLGTFALSAGYSEAYYLKACQVRRKISEDFNDAFSSCDVLVGPVTNEPAFELGEKSKDPIAMYYNDLFTTPASLAGLPAMSLPIGVTSDGLPVGLQIIGPSFKDAAMIQWAQALESQINFQEVPPAR